MALQRNQKDATFDYLLRMKDAGVIAASAAAQVGGAAQILDMGAQRFDGRVIVDITECEVATGNEEYRILVQGSTSASFANGVWNLGAIQLGDSSVSQETVDTAATRHQEIAFCNEVNGTVYRYVRVYTFVAGTVATGIGYTANLVQKG